MRAIVVEDSRLAREGLLRMLKTFPEIEVVGDAEHPEAARELVKRYSPELIFLDIHMPGESGFDLLESIDYSPRVIFTTAYAEHAIRSFDFNTIDYLLKPISHERLATAIAKLVHEQPLVSKYILDINSRMFIKDGEKCHLVALEKIRYFESCKNYVRVFFGQDNAFVKKSMSAVEERLPQQFFFRANRQYIINLQEIVGIEEAINDGYQVTMSDGKVLEISRRNAIQLKALLSF